MIRHRVLTDARPRTDAEAVTGAMTVAERVQWQLFVTYQEVLWQQWPDASRELGYRWDFVQRWQNHRDFRQRHPLRGNKGVHHDRCVSWLVPRPDHG